jgi:hypothetical protein
MSSSPPSAPVVVIGLSRSGTTLLHNVLAYGEDVHAESEPHLLWKSGAFHLPHDADLVPDAAARAHIRRRLLDRAGPRRLVEKSPPNCLRPELVRSVFPDAKIVVIERDPVACIKSNLRKSATQPTLAMSRLYSKYLSSKKRRGSVLRAQMKRASLTEQVRPRDAVPFAWYAARMALLRRRGLLPFGPKLAGFADIVEREGLVAYYARLMRTWWEVKPRFLDAFGERALTVRLETFQDRAGEEIARLVDFLDLRMTPAERERALRDLNVERLAPAAADPLAADIETALARLEPSPGTCGRHDA